MTARLAVPPVLAALLTLAFAHLGGTTALGAHPFWQTSVAWIGLLPGLVLALILSRLGQRTGLVISILLLLLAFSAAHFGKVRFAASYAEDALAGRFWYFGWIATMAATTALITLIARALLSRKADDTGKSA